MNEHTNHHVATNHESPEADVTVESSFLLSQTVKVPAQPASPIRVFIMACAAFLLICGIGIGVLLWMLVNHSVSNEQIRAQIESQLTAFLGANHSAIIGETKIALGDGGLLSIDASDVKILRDERQSLGVAREVGVKVKSLPLMTGTVVAESVTMRGASIAIDSFLPAIPDQELHPAWPRSVNLAAALQAVGESASGIARQVESAGLESLALEDTNLIGFDQFGLRSQSARLKRLTVNVVDGSQDRNDLEFNVLVETEYSDWKVRGRWTQASAGGGLLNLDAQGLSINDLVGPTASESLVSSLDHEVSLSLSAPFLSDGTPEVASATITVGAGAIPVGKGLHANLQQAVISLRLHPEDNLLSFERSLMNFDRTRMIMRGGIRYPIGDDDPVSVQPIFRLTIDEFQAFGLVNGEEPPKGKMELDGFLDPLRQLVEIDRIELNTPNGSMKGQASVRLDGYEPHVKLELGLNSMPVEEFKQFWPALLAPKARKWMGENMKGGQLNDAWVKADFPPGLIGRDEYYQVENLSARIPITGARLKNPGELPSIDGASGVLEVVGNHTNITLEKGVASLAGAGKLALGKSTLSMGNYALPVTPMTMNLNFTGPASAMVKLASLEPIGFSNRLKIQPADVSGSASAQIEAHFDLGPKLSIGKEPWKARLTTKNVSSRKPVNGRKMDKANFTISASPRQAIIKGTAEMDGVSVKLALVEPLDGQTAGQGKLSLTLSDADRAKMGLNTGDVISGPIQASVTNLPDGSQRVEANLKQARLNFPWIGWSKGKGIGATATFVLRRSDGVMIFQDMKLRGEGFSANGSFVVDKNGLREAKVSNVKLNKVDDFDIVATSSKKSFQIKLDARTYDGRALVRSLLNAKLKPNKNNAISISVTGRVGRLIGFGGQDLRNVKLDFLQRGSSVARVLVDALAAGNAPTRFALGPVPGGTKTEISTSNAGAVLRFLDLYTKISGGSINANLVRDDSQVFRGKVSAQNFILLNESRLAQLLRKPKAGEAIPNGDEVVRTLQTIKTDRAKVDQLQANIEKGPGSLKISKGRLTGGDASAAFDGVVYDRNNRMNIKGTFLPARTLNRMVSKIPIIGLAFGKGKVNGLLGITFRLSGRFDNPTLRVNPLSIIAPGVFRQLFKF